MSVAIETVDESQRAREAAPRLLNEYIRATGVETGAPWASRPALPEVLQAECEGFMNVFAAPGALFVAFEGPDAVGLVGLRDMGGGRANIRRLWVRPAFRSNGIAYALMKRCMSHAEGSDFDEVVLDVLTTRTTVVGWYRRLGFDEIKPFEEARCPMVFLGRRVDTGRALRQT